MDDKYTPRQLTPQQMTEELKALWDRCVPDGPTTKTRMIAAVSEKVDKVEKDFGSFKSKIIRAFSGVIKG